MRGRERKRYRLSPLFGAAAALGLLAAQGCDAGGGGSEAAAGVGPGEPAAEAPATGDERPVVLFLGDSLTAGYGLPVEQAFPALVQERIDAAGLDYRVVNAGVSGDTSAGGRRRIGWLLRQPVAVLVIELGGNDMLRGQDLGALAENLRAIVGEARAAHPGVRVVIAGMRAPVNLGPDYAAGFEATYGSLARETGSALIPFVLEGVAADPALNQPDGIHPTAEGHRIVAETVWRTLAPLL
jgi:acyl-CoA thioesterase-1